MGGALFTTHRCSWLVALLAGGLSACSAPSPKDDAGVDGGELDAGLVLITPTCGCTTWGNQRAGGQINPPLNELSGLAASRTSSD